MTIIFDVLLSRREDLTPDKFEIKQNRDITGLLLKYYSRNTQIKGPKCFKESKEESVTSTRKVSIMFGIIFRRLAAAAVFNTFRLKTTVKLVPLHVFPSTPTGLFRLKL
ncbi:hypothetical protein XENOCAPTIV_016456 [Xenoophorus captivus]|uniref:Uncharacterized protein n=1 Tax=Xenoophorus captivus TaxID=1517983 RepID=A0ABV0QM20_9TELE